jgi:hypothetical protein
LDLDRVFDLLDASAKAYPIKALADEIGKGESTLRNELTEQPGYKLGLRTAVLILRRTGDLRPLDGIEEMLGRIAFALPRSDKTDMIPILRLAGKMMQEFGEHTQALANALVDGKITRAEAEICLKELNDVLVSCIELRAHLERYL